MADICVQSLDWASKIAPNTGMMRLSTEVRIKIWKNVIKGIEGKISPRKALDKFSNNGSKKLGNREYVEVMT